MTALAFVYTAASLADLLLTFVGLSSLGLSEENKLMAAIWASPHAFILIKSIGTLIAAFGMLRLASRLAGAHRWEKVACFVCAAAIVGLQLGASLWNAALIGGRV